LENSKTIKDVFNDYKNKNSILEAYIQNINLYKKTNKLVLEITSNLFISLKEIMDFENYLKTRFRIETAYIKIKYGNETQIPNIESEWKKLLNFISKKYPLVEVILGNSKLNIEGNNLLVELQVKGKEFLEARKLDKILETLINDIYDKKYKINLIENLSEETMNLLENKSIEAQKQAIEIAKREIILEKENDNIIETPPIIEKQKEEPEKSEEDEVSPLIFGRGSNIKETLTKIIDLSVDSGKISLEGEILIQIQEN